MKPATISLLQEAGEYCTERSHPALPRLRSQIREVVEAGGQILIERGGVKLFTTSFMDELLSEIAKEFSYESVRDSVKFSPALDNLYWDQVKRGIRLRGG